MSSPATITKLAHDPKAQYRAILLVAISTLICAAAQILMKFGTEYSRHHPGLMGLLTDAPLIAGYALYAVMTVMIVVAFKDGELSILYPIISLSYVWVTLLSHFVFHDAFNVYKGAGLVLIMGGVAVIGRGAKA